MEQPGIISLVEQLVRVSLKPLY